MEKPIPKGKNFIQKLYHHIALSLFLYVYVMAGQLCYLGKIGSEIGHGRQNCTSNRTTIGILLCRKYVISNNNAMHIFECSIFWSSVCRWRFRAFNYQFHHKLYYYHPKKHTKNNYSIQLQLMSPFTF